MSKIRIWLLVIGVLCGLFWATADRLETRLDTSIYSKLEAEKISKELERGENPDRWIHRAGGAALLFLVPGLLIGLKTKR